MKCTTCAGPTRVIGGRRYHVNEFGQPIPLSHKAQPAVPQPRLRGECECHREYSTDGHESCCGHQDGVNPDCPIHGDGSRSY